MNPEISFAFRSLVLPWPPYAVFLLFVGLVSGVLPLAQVEAVRRLIDLVEGVAARPGVASMSAATVRCLPWLALVLFLTLMEGLMLGDTMRGYLAARLDERVRERLEPRLFRKSLSLELERFESPEYYDALQRAQQVLQRGVISDRMSGLARCLSLFMGYIGILIATGRVSPAIPALLLPGTAGLIVWQIWTMRRSIATEFAHTPLRRRQEYWRGLLTERAGAAELRLFGLGEHILCSWVQLTHRILDETWAARRRGVRRFHTMLAGNIALHSLVLLIAILFAHKGAMTVGGFIGLFSVIRDYPDRIHSLSWWLQRLHRFFVELGYLRRFLDLGPEESEEVRSHSPAFTQEIRFEAVGFVYPGSGGPALQEVTISIRPGERVAIVGENGAGKSTLVKLLLGLYRPTMGRITVDGIDLRNLPPPGWRRMVAAVLQEYVRFPFTVRENIGLGRLELLGDAEAVEQVAREVEIADDILRLPHGYDTFLGKEFEHGQDLSQGQWQKLAIARARLRGAVLAVLDEPASALDAYAERNLYRQFLSLASGKTVLLISHRLGSARLADRVLFLEKGRLLEQGTHDSLVAAGGQYAEMYRLQAEWYRDNSRGECDKGNE